MEGFNICQLKVWYFTPIGNRNHRPADDSQEWDEFLKVFGWMPAQKQREIAEHGRITVRIGALGNSPKAIREEMKIPKRILKALIPSPQA